MRLVSFGNLYVDYYMKDGIVEGLMGGKTNANILANLAHEYETFFIGCVGNDSLGDIAIRSLNGIGVKTKVKKIPKSTKAFFIDKSSFSTVCPYCNRKVGYTGDYLEESEILENLQPDDYLVIDNLHVLTTKILKKCPNKAFIDLGYYNDIRNKSLEELEEILECRFEIINMNERVYKEFKNKFILDSFDIYELFKPQILIITKGKRGCEIIFNDTILTKEIEDPEKEVDTNGAGDAFFSEFISFYLHNPEINEKTISSAYMKANIKARNVISQVGARSHLIPLYRIKDYKNCICGYVIVD